MAWQMFMLRVGVAALLGAMIGLERQVPQRLAGLRTNALVSIGAAAFVALAAATPAESSPTRVAAQVVSGIGFLGAGVIFREGLTVRGLNTAATLWCCGAVGSLAGSGMYRSGAITAALVLLANTGSFDRWRDASTGTPGPRRRSRCATASPPPASRRTSHTSAACCCRE
jgi:putative Mg2+ transporter-C (MgtC) family protein